MLMTDEELKDLREHILLARTNDIKFGICFGRSSYKGLIMNVDRQRTARMLERYAKLDGESHKSLRGTFRLSGNILTLSAENPLPKGGEWQLHQLIRKLGYTFRVTVDAPGPRARAQKTEQDTPEDPAEESTALVDSLQARWERLAPRLETALTQLRRKHGAGANAALAVWAKTQEVAARGDHASALKAAGRLKTLIFEDPRPAKATDPAQDKWRTVEAELERRIDAQPAGSERKPRLQQALDAARTRAASGDYASAAQIARRLAKALPD